MVSNDAEMIELKSIDGQDTRREKMLFSYEIRAVYLGPSPSVSTRTKTP